MDFEYSQNIGVIGLCIIYGLATFLLAPSLIETIRRASEAKEIQGRVPSLLSKLIVLKVLILLTVIDRLAVNIVIASNYKENQSKWRKLRLILCANPVLLNMMAFLMLSYIFYSICYDLIYYRSDANTGIQKARKALISTSIAIVVAYLMIFGVFLLKVPFEDFQNKYSAAEHVVYHYTKTITLIMCLATLVAMAVTNRMLQTRIKEICEFSGGKQLSKHVQLTKVVLFATSFHIILNVIKIIAAVNGHEFYSLLDDVDMFHYTVQGRDISFLVILWEIVYLCVMELGPCMYISLKMHPSTKKQLDEDPENREPSSGLFYDSIKEPLTYVSVRSTAQPKDKLNESGTELSASSRVE